MRDISYELIELIGRFDLQLCTQLISLYQVGAINMCVFKSNSIKFHGLFFFLFEQSCSNALEIEQVVEKSSVDPKNSLLVSYLHQQNFYQEKAVTYNSLNSPLIKQLLDATKLKFNAFKYLNPTINHFNLSKDLPHNYLVVIMQHNKAK